jgi:hypothetical protein
MNRHTRNQYMNEMRISVMSVVTAWNRWSNTCLYAALLCCVMTFVNKGLGRKWLSWVRSFVDSSVFPDKCWHNIFQIPIHYEHSNDNHSPFSTHAIVILSISCPKTGHFTVIFVSWRPAYIFPKLWRNLFENSTDGFQKLSRSTPTAII